MTTTQSILRHHDPRTGKSYAIRVVPDAPPMLGLKRMVEMAERDYQASLPVEQRAVANQATDFKCPHCKTQDEPTSRKVTKTSGGFFLFFGSVSTTVIDIFRCSKCDREFEERELYAKRREVEHQNWAAECLERYKDGEITDKVLISAVSAHN